MISWQQLKGATLRLAVIESQEKPTNRHLRMRVWKVAICGKTVRVHLTSTLRKREDNKAWDVVSRKSILEFSADTPVYVWKHGDQHLYFSHRGVAYSIYCQRYPRCAKLTQLLS
jgi:hypothetical protein